MPIVDTVNGSIILQPASYQIRTWKGNTHLNNWCSITERNAPGPNEFYTTIKYDCSTDQGQGPPPHKKSRDYIGDFHILTTLRLEHAAFEGMPDFTVLGSRVLSLTLVKCSMDIDNLLAFLRSFSNLKRLKISSHIFTPKPSTRARLDFSFMKSSPKKPTLVAVLPIKELILLGTVEASTDLEDPREKLTSFLAFSTATLKDVELNCEFLHTADTTIPSLIVIWFQATGVFLT